MKQRGRMLALVVALAAAVTLSAARPAVAQLTATDLGTLEGFSNSTAMAVNSSGMAVGYAYNLNDWGSPSNTQAVVWQAGATTPTALPLLSGYANCRALYVNASGQVAGNCEYPEYFPRQACFWTFDGTEWSVQGLGFPSGGADGWSEAYGMNAAGQVVGFGSGSVNDEGFIWDSTNGMQPFTNLPEGPQGQSVTIMPAPSHGISDNGLVVGTALAEYGSFNGAIVWDSTTGYPLFAMTSGEALAISPSGNQVAGYYVPDALEPEQQNAFLLTWNAGEMAFALTNLGHPAYDSGSPAVPEWTLAGWVNFPTSVTDDGKVVGFGRNRWNTGTFITNGEDGTWLYSDGAFTDLSTLLPAGTVGQIEVNAYINASGTVVFNVEGPGPTAFLWSGSGEATPLTGPGGGAASVSDISGSGFIAGGASFETDPASVHGVLWSPGSALEFSEPSVSVKGKALTVKIRIAVTNPSGSPVTDVLVTQASLDGNATTSSLPLNLRTIRSGASKTISLTFDSLSSGPVELKISGTCSLGAFFTTQTVIIP